MTTEPLICGLDEVGRGPLAGPLVAAAVILPNDFDFAVRFPTVRFGDSKKLTARQRNAAYDLIRENALVWRVMILTVAEINANGIGWANRAAFERLIAATEADQYIVDGNLKLKIPEAKQVQSVVRADQSVQAVSAASIIAKVTRDRIMHVLHRAYPHYHWATNMGYHSSAHMAAIREYGISPHHRHQFVQSALMNSVRSLRLF